MTGEQPIFPQTATHTLPPIVPEGHTFASVTDKISSIVLKRPTSWLWLAGFLLAFVGVMLLVYSIAYVLIVGVGVGGIDIPVAWGFAIVNFNPPDADTHDEKVRN